MWADNIIKINRQDGKVGVTREPSFSTPPSLWVTPPPLCGTQAVPHMMVVGVRYMYILEPKSFSVKSRVSLNDLDHVSVSAHSDGNCIFHITQVGGALQHTPASLATVMRVAEVHVWISRCLISASCCVGVPVRRYVSDT